MTIDQVLARKYHPDATGGDGALMKRVNNAVDWLRERLAGARR